MSDKVSRYRSGANGSRYRAGRGRGRLHRLPLGHRSGVCGPVDLGNIRKFIEKKLTKGKITQNQHDDILSRLSGTIDMEEAVNDAVMVVEAVFEDMNVKKEIFRKVDALCAKKTILASNTSSH